jgi:DNA polymerase-3 subunit epsilon
MGEESAHDHDARVAAALAPLAIPAWPIAGPGYVREMSMDGEHVDVHVFRDWGFVGTARDDAELADLVDLPPRASFDPDVMRLLLRRYRGGTLDLRPLVPA